MQKEIDFSGIAHVRENNAESESILNANLEHINGKCKLTYDLLKKGERLTVRSALLDYGISSLPRRILDLKEKYNLDIKTKLINGRFKEYYL